MARAFAAFTAFALALSAVSASATPALDAQGKCRDGGKFVAADKCKAAKPAPKQVCKDPKGKFAKCGTPGATPVKKAS